MNGITFYAYGNTAPLSYAVERLRKLGVTVTDTPSEGVTHLLLNPPSFDKDGLLIGGGSIYELLKQLPDTVTVIGGNLPKEALAHYPTIDLLHDARYTAENAALTADCAISLARQHLPIVWQGCPVLILGWGRIGKCLARMLRASGAEVTVAARKVSDIAMLQGLGYGAEDIGKLHHGLMRYRVIFNTVPAPVLTAKQTAHCHPDCLLMELASSPGIEGDKVISALRLPGKYAPESSGRLIASSVIRLILGREC